MSEDKIREENTENPEVGEKDTERELCQLRSELKKKEELYQRAVRALAELSNRQKRIEEQAELWRKTALENFIRELIPLLDDLEATLGASEEASREKLIEAIQLLNSKLLKSLEKHGVNGIEPGDEKYDPAYHEAIEVIEDSGLPDMTIVEVVRRGYILADRVIRPALVKVSRKPPEKQKEEKNADL